MQPQQLAAIIDVLGATSVQSVQSIQSLWGGYGELVQVYLTGYRHASVIVKHITLPQAQTHPKGWATDLSHQRKLRSYQVESYWYQDYANHCTADCVVPKCLWLGNAITSPNADDCYAILLVLEDLTQIGFSRINHHGDRTIIQASLTWLAHFHGQFMQHDGQDLWPIGTYWHLATRPDELAVLQDDKLKNAATELDYILNNCPFKTLVHGDAKLANFCFTPDNCQAAAVDFQYVGQGCGMKDVVYFLSSVLPFNQPISTIETTVETYLDFYFIQLSQSVGHYHPDIDVSALVNSWRSLYPIAWADFHRFIKGWSPEHQKINAYSEALTQQALLQLI
ncbi:phosphotransferase [Shewanella sp. OMA3-2]|uniref:phosphotransferase n=1 Tax=Shewanella sp. OMA3-2 TaxID=2908650 RepID=UPI001F2833A7|nr:phosphotransferase [Shewanella sp. OMA3-2]UJF22574.1 aminoglycoside phosphotransferase family protein [Shewanella sp. OMA3-2]